MRGGVRGVGFLAFDRLSWGTILKNYFLFCFILLGYNFYRALHAICKFQRCNCTPTLYLNLSLIVAVIILLPWQLQSSLYRPQFLDSFTKLESLQIPLKYSQPLMTMHDSLAYSLPRSCTCFFVVVGAEERREKLAVLSHCLVLYIQNLSESLNFVVCCLALEDSCQQYGLWSLLVMLLNQP